MTESARLVGIRAKTERGNKHISDLDCSLKSFMETNPYEIGTKKDPDTGNIVYELIRADEIPVQLPLIAGDAIQNLRSALDYLACELVKANGQSTTTRTSFPFSISAEKYKTDSPGKVKGMSQPAIDLIDATKPYPGGNDALWAIHNLNNIDKHNLLFVAGIAYQGTSIGSPKVIRDMMRQFSRGMIDDLGIGFTIPVGTRSLPLKTGYILHILPREAENDVNVYFKFGIAFGEPEVVKGKPVLETLQEFVHLVDGIVNLFVPLL